MATAIIGGLLGTDPLHGAAELVNAIRGKDPVAAAKAQDALNTLQQLREQHVADFQIASLTDNEKLNETAGQNIRAEAASSKYAADARPSVIYAGLIVILVNYALMALVPRSWGWKPVEIPQIVWEIWCVCVTGYVFARSGDKLFSGAGGSLSLPFGIKADSKGD